nr:MAG TPA: hypothetical protein [Caudoviricetes sp.]
MRGLIYTIILAFVFSFMIGCKSKTAFVPVESIKTEYKDRLEKDSIYLHDSVFVEKWKSNDTVFLTKEKYKYLYRDKLVRDTICKTDSIAIPFPVVETKEVNKLHSWQIILMILGGVLIGYLGFRLVRLFK